MNHVDQICRLILEEDFGPIVRDVCMYLYNNPILSVREIARGLGIKLSIVKKSLLFLMQNHIVCHSKRESKNNSGTFVYNVVLKHIIARLYYSNFIRTVQEELGEESKIVYGIFICFGRLSLKGLRERVNNGWTGVDRNNLIQIVKKLIDTKFIVRSETSSSHFSQEWPSGGNMELNVEKSATEAPKGRQKRKSLDSSEYMLAKRARSDVNLCSESINKIELTDENTYYCINYDRAFISIRNNLLINLTNTRIHKLSSLIVKAILDLTSNKLHDIKTPKYTREVHINEIKCQLEKEKIEFKCMPQEPKLEHYINLIIKDDSFKIHLLESSTSPQCYYLDLPNASNNLKIAVIDSIAYHAFGLDTRRVWRVIHEKGTMHETHIANSVLAPIKIVRMCLFQMLQAGLVFIHSIPKSMDLCSARTFYLWGTDVQKTSKLIAKNAYGMISKLKNSRKEILLSHERLFQKMRRQDVISGEAELTEKELETYEKAKLFLCDIAIAETYLSEIIISLMEI